METMVRFFADEMLPYLGIKGKVKMIAPTEEIHMEIKIERQEMVALALTPLMQGKIPMKD